MGAKMGWGRLPRFGHLMSRFRTGQLAVQVRTAEDRSPGLGVWEAQAHMKELEGREFTTLTLAPGAPVYCQQSREALLGPEPASAAVTLTFMDRKTGPRLLQEALFLRS